MHQNIGPKIWFILTQFQIQKIMHQKNKFKLQAKLRLASRLQINTRHPEKASRLSNLCFTIPRCMPYLWGNSTRCPIWAFLRISCEAYAVFENDGRSRERERENLITKLVINYPNDNERAMTKVIRQWLCLGRALTSRRAMFFFNKNWCTI